MVLAHRPRQKWNSMWNNNRLPNLNRTNEQEWKTAMLIYRKFYAPSKRARDEVVDYLKSEAVKKSHSSSCQAHADRVETCCARANILHGIREPLSDREIKEILFKSFPKPWQNDYTRSGRDVVDDSIEQIVQYMTEQKGIADEEQQQRSRKRPAEDDNRAGLGRTGRQRKNNNNNNNRNNRQDETPEEKRNRLNAQPCRKHKGQHLWGECRANKYGYNRNNTGRNQSNQGSYNRNQHQSNTNGNNNNKRFTPGTYSCDVDEHGNMSNFQPRSIQGQNYHNSNSSGGPPSHVSLQSHSNPGSTVQFQGQRQGPNQRRKPEKPAPEQFECKQQQ